MTKAAKIFSTKIIFDYLDALGAVAEWDHHNALQPSPFSLYSGYVMLE